jgi:hypothetical protein
MEKAKIPLPTAYRYALVRVFRISCVLVCAHDRHHVAKYLLLEVPGTIQMCIMWREGSCSSYLLIDCWIWFGDDCYQF